MKRKFIVIPITEFQQDFYYRVVRFANLCNIAPLSETHCNKVVRLIIDDLINSRMIWSTLPSNSADRYIQQLYPWHNEDNDNELSTFLEDKVLSPFRVDYLSKYFEGIEKGWAVWSVVDDPADFGIREEGDYRILDWERRMCTGVWEHDNARLLRQLPELSPDDIAALIEQEGEGLNGTET